MKLFIATLVALAVTASASHDPCPEQPTAQPEVTTPETGVSVSTLVGWSDGPHPGVYYIDNDVCQPECLFSVWLYEETNGIPGLQRSDEVCDCTCYQPPGDTIIF